LFDLAVRVVAKAGRPRTTGRSFAAITQLTGVSQSNVPASLKQLWTYEAGDSIESSAAIVGGTVFVGSQKGELVALSLENGSVYWKFRPESDRRIVTGLQQRRRLHRRSRRLAQRVNARRQEAVGLQSQRRDQIVAGRRRRSRVDWSYDENLYCLSRARLGAVEVQDERTSALDARHRRRHGVHRRLR
jgi:glucose dehydrogenase